MSSIEQLSEEDSKKIKNCDFYLQSKKIMKSFEHYKSIQVGEVYSVSYLSYDDKITYIKRHGSNNLKDKFLVIHKDEGFIFAKRINSSGGLSKEVICMTIRFPHPDFCLELDSDQAESIIFQNEEAFDPFKQGKDLSKRKNKARKINNTKKVIFSSSEDAVSFVKKFKKGDTVYDSGTAFGEGVVEWIVKAVSVCEVDKTPQKDWNGDIYSYGKTDIDRRHNKYHIDKVIIVDIEVKNELPSTRKWISKTRSITFIDFFQCPERHRDYYLIKPISIDEV